MFVPCCQGDRLLLLTFQECINPGDWLLYGEGTEQEETNCSNLVQCKSWEQAELDRDGIWELFLSLTIASNENTQNPK